MNEPEPAPPRRTEQDLLKSAVASTAALVLVGLAGLISSGAAWIVVLYVAALLAVGVVAVTQWSRYVRRRRRA